MSCSGTLIILHKLFRPHLRLAQRKLEAFTISAACYSMKSIRRGQTRKAAVKFQAISSVLPAGSSGSINWCLTACFCVMILQHVLLGMQGQRGPLQVCMDLHSSKASLVKPRRYFAKVQGLHSDASKTL